MILKLEPDDLEIELSLGPGPIIHIFPKTQANLASGDIIKGLSVLEKIEQLQNELEKLLLDPHIDEKNRIISSNLKNIISKILKDAENKTIEFFEKQMNSKFSQDK